MLNSLISNFFKFGFAANILIKASCVTLEPERFKVTNRVKLPSTKYSSIGKKEF